MQLQVLTPEAEALCTDVSSVNLQGCRGRLGILESHTNFISKLDFGVLEYTEAGKHYEMLCGSGIVEVNNNQVTVLVRSAERNDDVNIDRAKEALQRAKSRLGSNDKEVNLERAQDAQARAAQRLRFVGKL
ncbi:ATP synthase F1 subunit epsilon [Acanthopleuribacter pedis]|uniref:ATP synthase epsilon chain n=1 Tax=Acanthopleuribacter pedis TaxID=442870 RepID=A0A8J7Q5S9_9BACT|nr:ATP synthase F1 subunit epsilon [Acanthopleuribacter pedis]MBO1317164.1 ATP synthase F1 subunit epsilon [Acanthopleuribacter pedis]